MLLCIILVLYFALWWRFCAVERINNCMCLITFEKWKSTKCWLHDNRNNSLSAFTFGLSDLEYTRVCSFQIHFFTQLWEEEKIKVQICFLSKLEHDNPKSVQCWASTNLTINIWKIKPRGSRPNFCWYVDEDKLELKHVCVNLAINVSLVYNGSIFRLDCKILYDQS